MSRTGTTCRPKPKSVARLDAVLRDIAQGTLALPRPFLKTATLRVLRPTRAACEHDGTGIIALQRAVAEVFGLRRDDLIARRRTKDVVLPRQVAMYLACELTGASLPQIGRAFDRDHTTVLHACRRVKAIVRRDAALAGALARLREPFRVARAEERVRDKLPESKLEFHSTRTRYA